MTTSERPDEPSDPRHVSPPFQAFSELLRRLAAMPGQGPVPEPGGYDPRQVAGLVYGPLMQLAGQVMLALAASGLRSWARTAEILGTTLPTIAEVLADMSQTEGDPAEKARRVDELRASLRELAELPGRESQRLQAEFDRLIFGVGPDTGERTGSTADTPWRRWDVKP